MTYPLISFPSEELTPSNRFEWSTAQAKQFYAWFMDSMPARISGLMSFLGLPGELAASREGVVRAELRIQEIVIGKLLDVWVAPATTAKSVNVKGQVIETVKEGDLRSTPEGYSLSVDMGIMTSNALVKLFPSLNWKMQKSRGREVSKNLPVISGFGESWRYYCPFTASQANVEGIAKHGKNEPKLWVSVFDSIATCVNGP
ncbi:hypothetical protein ANRL2_04057 [Anaerolineae bacterium]|nr:hypothetical protein ANRL2_04057 [Anaerolineae bacterium]